MASDGDTDSGVQWKLSTNWTIAAGGSLSETITVDSSETLDDDKPPSPLVLISPSPHSDPCQINILFSQKREVRQVYVRSTARVYEIYSARSQGSSNDYLCTVRCGIATRGDEVLHATDVESVGAHPKDSNGGQEKENCSSSEDDWVEVKVLDMPSKDAPSKFDRERNGAKPRANFQDLYEATAEFTDSDACTSLTLRLLSLQTKGKINIDEIYIFADPDESGDLEAQADPVGNSAATSLMSMLVPTILQLSKSGNVQKQHLHAPDSSEKEENLDVGSKENHVGNVENKSEQINIDAVTKEPEVHIPERASDTGERDHVAAPTYVLNNRVESILEQLVSRVSRIEDICLRFEENMLNPIKSMEQRLQLVEEQVQVLAKNSQQSKLPAYIRISAPEFSCTESSSFYNEGTENPSCGEVELGKKETTTDEVPNFSNAKSRPGLATGFYTRICAPEFSCGESMSSSFYNEGNENPSCGEVELGKKETTDEVPNFSNAKSRPGLAIGSYTRICAPEFSCGESMSSSFCNEGNENPSCGEVELEKKDTTDEVPNSSNAKFHHGLGISAPEFSSQDDEENGGGDDEAQSSAVGPVNDCPSEKPRQGLSIDDARAAALVGFMSNTRTKPAHHAQAITIEAPEFTAEEDGSDGTPTKQKENVLVPPIFHSESNGTDSQDGIVSSSSNEDIEQDKLISDSVCTRSEDEPDLAQIDDTQIAGSTSIAEPGDEITGPVSVKDDILDLVSEKTEVEVGKGISEYIFKFKDYQKADSTRERKISDGAMMSVFGNNKISKECSTHTKREGKRYLDDSIIDSPWPSCEVDFELPILDVKFTPSEFVSTSSLEALFDNMPECVVEASSTEQKHDGENIYPIPNNPVIVNLPSSLKHKVLDSAVDSEGKGSLF